MTFMPRQIKQTQRVYKHLKFIYESNKITAFKRELPELKKSKKEIEYLIESRNNMIEMVYNNLDETKIYLPIHFMNLIENIKHRFNINASSLST